jgi:hypothetical protein
MTEPTYFAQIDEENEVTDVRVVSAEYMAENPELYPGVWIQTYIGVEGKTYAAVGYIYDYATDNFYAPLPVVNP